MKKTISYCLPLFVCLIVTTSIPSHLFAANKDSVKEHHSEYNPFTEGSKGFKECLRNALGDEAFDAITRFKRLPTAAEEELMRPCSHKFPQADMARYNLFTAGTKQLRQCVKNALRDKAFNDIQGKRPPTDAERKLIDDCMRNPSFQKGPDPFPTGPQALKDCLKKALGDEASEVINQSKRQLTDAEEKLIYQCMQKWAKELENRITSKHPLAQNMLKVYRDIQTYHAKWESTSIQSQDQKFELEVAFERKTNRILFFMQEYKKMGKRWIGPIPIQLIMYDNKKFKSANPQGLDIGPGIPIQKDERKMPGNYEFNYRDFRRSISMQYPLDLPLLSSETPLHEILQGTPNKIRTIDPNPNNKNKHPRLELVSRHSSTFYSLRLDPKTHYIEEFSCYEQAPRKQVTIFKQLSFSIDKKLDANLFNFETQLKKFDSEETKKLLRINYQKPRKMGTKLNKKELAEMLKGIENISELSSFHLYTIAPISKRGVKLSMRTSHMSSGFKFVDELKHSPLFENVHVQWTARTKKGCQFEIVFYFTEKAKDKKLRTKELKLLEDRLEKIDFK